MYMNINELFYLNIILFVFKFVIIFYFNLISRSFAASIMCPSLSLVWAFTIFQLGCCNSMEIIR